MTSTPTQQLSDAGVSIWLDDLSRGRLKTGTLQKLIEEKNVVGVTTNPSIFHAAITTCHDYDDVIAKEAAAGASIEETIFEITTTDVADACDLFAPIAAATNGLDGRVSIEVDPRLAWDTAGTIAEAKHLYKGNDAVEFAESAMDAVRGADALVIVTEWKAFRSPDFEELKSALKSPVIFDGRNLYEPAVVRGHGLEYHPIGR